MTDINTVARRYIELWNEKTPSRRREMLASDWTVDAKYVDPLMSGDGHDGVGQEGLGVGGHWRPLWISDFRFQIGD